MSNNNLTIDLKARTDTHGRTYYVGKVKAPVLIDCYKGATFLIFISEKGEEALQVALMDNDKDDY